MTPARPDPALNGAWLRELLVTKGVKKPKAKWELSDSAYRVLAINVAVLAFHHANPPQSSAPSFLDEDGMSAAHVLLERLSLRRDDALRAAQSWLTITHFDREQQLQRWNAMVAGLETAIANVEALLPLLRPSRPPLVRETWHDYAIGLARQFLSRLRECNPEMTFGLAAEGPVAAFIYAVAPFITGNVPKSLGSVALFLKEHRTEVLLERSHRG